MGAARKPDLDRRLEAYFATLGSSSLEKALKYSAANWQLYAAVTGSAMAMVTGASAAMIGSGIRDIAAERVASVRAAKQHLGSSKNAPPLMKAVRLAMARQDSRAGFNGAGVTIGNASQAQGVPSISLVVPVYSTVSIIQPGEWITIYGSNLSVGNAVWNGDFPLSLSGTSVEINGKSAYLSFVSPDQINLQAPDDTATGTVSVVVTSTSGRATGTVTMGQFAPSFNLLDERHVAAVILRTNGLGAYGGGAYDILGPTGDCFGYRTVAAQPGDVVELFGVGFGPTTPTVLAGKIFSGAAPTNNPVTVYINNFPITPTFVGLSSAGLYQINLIVPPGLGEGDVPIQAMVGGMQTQPGVLFSLPLAPGSPPIGCSNGGTGGTGTGGSGGGGSGRVRRRLGWWIRRRFGGRRRLGWRRGLGGRRRFLATRTWKEAIHAQDAISAKVACPED